MTNNTAPAGCAAATTAAVTPRYIPDAPKSSRLADVFIILICLFAAFWFIRLFYNSLFQTLSSNLEPLGHVTMKNNNIQRRQSDRVLWDRINNESLIYPGDLICVAENSGVNLHFDNNSVELDENTMIRVTKSPDGQIKLEFPGFKHTKPRKIFMASRSRKQKRKRHNSKTRAFSGKIFYS